MRTDPTIASILASYITAIIGANWSIDPSGADPATVKVCTESLGLPVSGEKHDDIGAARRRGVKWVEHLRLSSLHLIFGHMAFEPIYEVRADNLAYLVALPERMPNTITDIEVADDGTLKSITQEGRPGKSNTNGGVTIPADRLLWYVHEREGAVYQGRALIRPCYSDWLLKIDGKRVNATGLARFGAGTPVMEALPGTQPTPAQIGEAQKLASAVRVGVTGGAVPVGFTLRIKGVEGTLPDAIPILNYYDQQMARAALTSLLDLGNTATGSRALGDTFADIMNRALKSIADRMAETATELCVRLTDFNFGPEAVPPRVIVGDVGASAATIAQSVALLIQAGAITPDAGTEDYMRKAYNLPAAVPPPEPSAPAVPVLTAVPVAASAPLRAAAQPTGYRPPTEQEQAAGLDPQQIDDDHDGLVAEGLALFAAIVVAWGAALAAQIIAAMTAGSLVALARMRLKTGDAVEALQLVMHEAASTGVRQALAEATRAGVPHGVQEADVTVDLPTLDDVAEALAENAAGSLAAAAGREAARHGLDGDPKTTANEAVQTVTAPGPMNAFISEAVARAMAGGRTAAMETIIEATPGIDWTIFHSAVRDNAACERCRKHDGTVYPDLEAGRQDFPLGLYKFCLGRTRCRCLLAMRPSSPATRSGL